MHRIRRWLVNCLCLLSLIACLGAGWLWRQSNSWQPGVVWDYTTRVSDERQVVERWELEAYCASGGLLVEAARWRYDFAHLRQAGVDPHYWPDQRELNP